MTTTSLITIEHLQRSYGSHPVLTDVTCEVEPGITGLLGANGSGKTTLLGIIIGLHPCDGGRIEVLGRDPWRDGAAVRERLGYAPEHHQLPPDLRAADFVTHVAELHGLPRIEARTRASDALWLVGLGEERFRALGTMSTGQRQRVKLAQAIAHDPDLVLLDEPTDGLDPGQRDAMLGLIRDISREFSTHFLLSSHLLDEVQRVCEHVVILGDGRALASGSVAGLRAAESVLIEVDGSTAETARLGEELAAAGAEVQTAGRTIEFGLGPADRAEARRAARLTTLLDLARDHCVRAELGLVRLERRQRSLEDVFLDRMEGSERGSR